jgi:YesN/AraC family two-component response regulator
MFRSDALFSSLGGGPTMGDAATILFVDDEDSIRLTLPPLLESYGFEVASAATVAEALDLITQCKFDVLISDLNIGHPGDGFTVVSAMRRHQPEALRFILTGYPAFESALEAIREEVHDYLIKPTEPDMLVEKIRSKLATRTPDQGILRQRLPQLIGANKENIVEHWLQAVQHDAEIGTIPVPDAERKEHLPLLLQIAIGVAEGKELTAKGHGGLCTTWNRSLQARLYGSIAHSRSQASAGLHRRLHSTQL